MYSDGRGVAQDFVLAHMWFSVAAAQGHKIAPQNRDLVAGKMKPEQVAEAQRLAGEWQPKPEPQSTPAVKESPGVRLR
jgi:TPR repeat protein